MIYWLYLILVEGRDLLLLESLIKAFSISHIASNCWYIVALIYFYVAFSIGAWICVKINRYHIPVIISTLMYLLSYYGYYQYYNIQHPETVIGLHWVYSTGILIAGILWGCIEERLEINLGMLCLGASLVAAGILLYERITNDRWNIELHNVSALAYVIMVLYASKRIKLGNRILDFLGEISFELYMIHGFIMKMCIRYLGIEHQTIFGIAVVTLSILTAWGIHEAFLVQKRILKHLPVYGRKPLKTTAVDSADNR